MTSKVLINTELGILHGIQEEKFNGVTFYSFLGIPYASPPIGKLRFKAPIPPKSWQGIRDATKENEGCYCYDIFSKTIGGSEDCLYLNIFTTNISKGNSSLMPVMVWFHGGGFITGSANRYTYGPDFLIDKGIVLVTVNYRLGPLGFLYLKDQTLGVHGNAGLKDQNMALKWVQANIKEFGGNPLNVTIFGQSSGAASVCCHLVSPMSKGLFHKAIMQSGVANCLWAEGNIDAAYMLIEKLGKDVKPDAEVFEILQNISKEDLLKAQMEMQNASTFYAKALFCPVVETHNNIDTVFLPDKPLNIIKSSKYNKVPIIMGTNSGEYIFMQVLELAYGNQLKFKTYNDLVPSFYKIDEDFKFKIASEIIKQYYGEQDPFYSSKLTFHKYLQDVCIIRPILDCAENIMRTSNEKVFMYKFGMDTKLNLISTSANFAGKGASHSAEITYIFKNGSVPEVSLNSIENTAIQTITKWWTNFAKCGDPNGIEDDALLYSKWLPSSADQMQYLEIDKSINMKENYSEKNNKFWKSIDTMVANAHVNKQE